jgi:hypothetical protein
MRFIQKSNDPPTSIREWRTVQEPVGVNLDYYCFTRGPQLRAELVAEQLGLCAYTGTPLDDRLGTYQGSASNLSFHSHIEHIKPRSVCQAELEARGGVYGCEICEDMDHRNLVAALEVERKPPAKAEIFGAAAHGNEPLPVTPVQPNCEVRFAYDDNGGVVGADVDADDTIKLLRLNHTSLQDWRRGAIAAFFPPGEALTREEVQRRIEVLTTPTGNRLPEFSFCIRSYAMSLLSAA